MESPTSSGSDAVLQRPDYETYLQSDHWRILRLRSFDKANRRCESCRGVKPLHGHHLRYKRLLDCTEDDIMALCEDCHSEWHKHYNAYVEEDRGFVRGFLAGLRKQLKPKKTFHPPQRKRLPVESIRMLPRNTKSTWNGTLDFFISDPEFQKHRRKAIGTFKRWLNVYYRGFTNKKAMKKKALELHRQG